MCVEQIYTYIIRISIESDCTHDGSGFHFIKIVSMFKLNLIRLTGVLVSIFFLNTFLEY